MQLNTDIAVDVKVKTRLMDARTGKVVKERPWEKNLVLDQGLNALAQDTTNSLQCFPATCSTYCQIGSSNTAVKVSSGAVTFTQAGTTLTASAGFFTASMVNGLFKWGTGTGGVEVYITGFTSTTQVTVATSATVSTPEVGTVWMVQQTALQSFLFTSNTYQTLSGDCSTTVVGNVITIQRTYIFGVQASPYSVNEIGWNPTSSTSRCLGRLVLSSTDVVGTSNFYVVVLAISFTYSPSSPTAVADVGTNVNTAGNAMIEWLSVRGIDSSGQPLTTTNVGGLGGQGNVRMVFAVATYTQNATPDGVAPVTLTWTGATVDPTASAAWAKVSGSLGKMRASCNGSATTTGQTIYGVGIYSITANTAFFQNPFFDIKFTTPQTLPNGAFLPQSQWDFTYTRTLNN